MILQYFRRSRWTVAFAVTLAVGLALAAVLLHGTAVRAQMADTKTADTAAAMPQAAGDKLDWGTDFETWTFATGYMYGRGHGSRLVRIRVTPWSAAQTYVHNAETIRHLRPDLVTSFPVGTMISMQTWDITAADTRGEAGPIFFMKKEPAGYDPDGGDWRYGMTRADHTVLADGKDGRATACRTCHLGMKDRDFVQAVDR